MAFFAFDNEGAFSNVDNLTVSTPGDPVEYLLYNFSGSAADLTILHASALQVFVTSSSGVVFQPNNNTRFKINADEVYIIRVATGSAANNNTWRISAGQTTHGLSAKRGVGHTKLTETNDPDIGIYLGTVG